MRSSSVGAEHPTVLLPDTSTVDQLAIEALPAFIAVCAALQARAATRLISGTATRAAAPDATETERLLTVSDAAKQLNFAPSYVYELARAGAIASVRRGRYVRIMPAAIAEFLAKHQRIAIDTSLSKVGNGPARGVRAGRETLASATERAAAP